MYIKHESVSCLLSKQYKGETFLGGWNIFHIIIYFSDEVRFCSFNMAFFLRIKNIEYCKVLTCSNFNAE